MTAGRQPATAPGLRDATEVAASVKALVAAGDHELARERFGDLVRLQQRRASRLAFYYLRDRAEADDAVQDAFLKAFVALVSFDERLSFDTWFARIVVNGCLDRLKSRGRRARWLVEPIVGRSRGDGAAEPPAADASPEDALLSAERGRAVRAMIDELPDRQRSVTILTQLDGRSTAEVSAITGLSESTVRVHLFRAMRRLRREMGRLGVVARPTER